MPSCRDSSFSFSFFHCVWQHTLPLSSFTEKERLALEDTLATKRDAKNARVGLYIALIVMVLTEVLRLAITHSF